MNPSNEGTTLSAGIEFLSEYAVAIKVNCAKCGGTFSAALQHAGKSGKCPRCQHLVKIPANEGPVTPTTTAAARPVESHRQRRDPAALMAELRAAFQGPIEPVRTSLSYKLGLVLVSALMLLLPAVYLAIIALTALGVYLHVVHSVGLLSARLPGVLLYITPPVAGGILLFFMVKPLFAPARDDRGTRSLTRDGEPVLFDFVDQICAAVGSPKPSRIDVDSRVNASAGFRNGWRSMLGRDLVLTIGVPLVAGLNTRQFAGVLAHEFGHFSQGAGMRLSYFIRSINAWFERVVYHRDSWDEWLEETAADADWRISIVLHLTRLCIWLTRRILWALMMLGHLGSSLFTREMEYDADRYEARLVGGDTFASTHMRIVLLGAAEQAAMSELALISKEGRLADNLPKYVVATADDVTPQSLQKFAEAINNERTGWFDTHPSAPQRIASAKREQTDGVFRLERPASVLFSNFDQLAKNVTWDIYRGAFGQTFEREKMHDTNELLARRTKEHDSDSAIDSYCQGCFTLLRPLQLPTELPHTAAQPKQTLERLKQARETFLAECECYRAMLKEYDQADTALLELRQAHELLYAGATIQKGEFTVATHSTTAVARAREEAQTTQGRLDDKLKVCETALGARLHAALQLLSVPQVAARIQDAAQLRSDSLRYYEAINSLSPQISSVKQLRNEYAALGSLCSRLQRRNSEDLLDSVGRSMKEVRRLLTELHTDLMRVDYPFEHVDPSISVARYCVASIPLPDDLSGLLRASDEMLSALAVVYRRLFKQLVLAAEQVETAVGLPKLVAPASVAQAM